MSTMVSTVFIRGPQTRMAKGMVMVYCFCQMETVMMAISRMGSSMDLENIHLPMEHRHTKVRC